MRIHPDSISLLLQYKYAPDVSGCTFYWLHPETGKSMNTDEALRDCKALKSVESVVEGAS